MKEILKLAEANRKRALQIIRDTDVYAVWQAVGAEVHLVGSLSMGLMMKHRDIDFHIYSSPLRLADSFAAMARLAACPAIERIECVNLLHTEEACVEWHAWYRDADGERWQIDMIHLVKGSRYDGYFERMAARIAEVVTEEQRETILRLKYETPADKKIMGVEYYQAVIRDGVCTYAGLEAWRAAHPVDGIVEWIP